MKAGIKSRFSIAFGAASVCSLLGLSVWFSQRDAREENPDAELSTEGRAVDHLKETAAELLEVLLMDFPTDKLLVGLVPELPYLHHPTKAVALLEYALEHNPNNPMLCRLMAEVAFDNGDYEKAITYFRKTAELSKKTREIRIWIATSLVALGRYQEVVDSLEEKVEDSASPSESYYLLGQAFTQLGNYTRAKECLEEALRSNPQDTRLAFALGKVFMRLKEPEKAKPYLDAFRKQQAARNSGALEAAKKRVEPEVRQRTIPVPWERGEIANILSAMCVRGSRLYRASRRTERAEQILKKGQGAFRKAIDLAPEQPDTYREFARLYLEAGQNSAMAARLAEQAVTLEASAQNYLTLGRAYRANAESGRAISALRQSTELEPEWLAPKNDLAWILATHADAAIRLPTEAVRVAEQAAAMVKYRNPHVLNTLAAAYASAEQFARAEKAAKDALAIARATNNRALADDIGKQLELYKKKKPYRESN